MLPPVQLATSSNGADAELVEATVARPIGQPVTGVDNALDFQSASGSDGRYGLTVTFAHGTNPDIDTVDVQTSLAFILGLLPLVIAAGARALGRRALGMPLFGGMIASAPFGIFVAPMLYLVFQRGREITPGRDPQSDSRASVKDAYQGDGPA